eukprot:contig_30963_g7573
MSAAAVPAETPDVAVATVAAPAEAATLKHHLSTQSHKSAVRKVVDASPEAENGAPAPVDASASVDGCRALLSAPATPAQEVLRNRYLASAWPASVTAGHLPRVPILSVRADSAVCYQCSTVAPTAKHLVRAHQARTDAEGASSCGLRAFHVAHVQSLQRGNKLSLFPVAMASSTAAAGGGRRTAPQEAATKRVSSSTLPLDVFLMGPAKDDQQPERAAPAGSAATSAAGPTLITTSEATDDNQCGGLLQMYRFHDHLAGLSWTTAGVADHFGLFVRRVSRNVSPQVETSGFSLEPTGSFFLGCIHEAVKILFNDALSYLRKSDMTTLLSRLRVGQTSDLQLRRFNIHVTEPTLVRYARDVAIVIYVVLELAALAARSPEAALAAGNASVSFGVDTHAAAIELRDGFREKAAKCIRRLRARRERARQPQEA